jgi:DNA-binding NarL/FixJ family response regulator
MIRVAIEVDHAIIRKAMKLFLKKESDIKIVGEAKNGQELLNLLKDKNVDVLLLDIDMPKVNGLAVLRDLDKAYPRLNTLIFSMHPEAIYGVNSRRMGAKGYLSKNANPKDIIHAIKEVYNGNTVFNDDLYKFNRHGYVPQVRMSKRESQVMKMLVAGMSNKAIAEELDISDKTVSTYKLRLMRKLKAKSVVDLVHYSEMNPA